MLEAVRLIPIFQEITGSNRLLPARMAPLPDELLSSWLVRLAMAHGIKLHSFSVEVFGRKTQIWNRDIDKSADKRLLKILTERTSISFDRIVQTTLAVYAGKIYEKHNPKGNTVWIMPLRIYHRQRLRCGLQFCPYCLLEDAEPYYRREWRLSWISVCEKHGIRLLDRCPSCQNPIVFHRQEMGLRNQPVSFSMIECAFCETHWTAQKWLRKCVKADQKSIDFQVSLKKIVDDSWGEIPGSGLIHSILYFKGLKQILRILSVCNRSVKFREEIIHQSSINIPLISKDMNFDHLRVDQRYQVLQAAKWLLDRWSEGFIGSAQNSRTWSSVLLPQNGDVPFWYSSIIKENLSQNFYSASEQEIISALYLLEKTHLEQECPILPIHLTRFMQSRDIFRKKSRIFVTTLYSRIKTFNQELNLNWK